MTFVIIFLSVIIVPILFIFLFLTFTEYKPDEIETSKIYRKTKDKDWGSLITVTSYNIGYCGMDKSQRRTAKDIKLSTHFKREHSFDNLISITNTIKEIDSDFYLLQQVDHDSARSSKMNQMEHLTSDLTTFNASFTYNYKSKYVPFPFNSPVGSVNSGLLTLSKFRTITSKRFRLSNNSKYPLSIFSQKNCLMINEYDLPRKKKLYMINVHLSELNHDLDILNKQFEELFEYITHLYDGKKNYIVVGGDFNFLLNKKDDQGEENQKYSKFPEYLYESSFKPVFDLSNHSMKDIDGLEHTIDGFLVSQNVKVQSCKTYDENFEHSNHNPVTLTFKL